MITHRWGNMEPASDVTVLQALLQELDASDAEHGDVAISDESGWTLSATTTGAVVWENVESDADARHQLGVPREHIAELFEALASGDLGRVDADPWLPGYA